MSLDLADVLTEASVATPVSQVWHSVVFGEVHDGGAPVYYGSLSGLSYEGFDDWGNTVYRGGTADGTGADGFGWFAGIYRTEVTLAGPLGPDDVVLVWSNQNISPTYVDGVGLYTPVRVSSSLIHGVIVGTDVPLDSAGVVTLTFAHAGIYGFGDGPPQYSLLVVRGLRRDHWYNNLDFTRAALGPTITPDETSAVVSASGTLTGPTLPVRQGQAVVAYGHVDDVGSGTSFTFPSATSPSTGWSTLLSGKMIGRVSPSTTPVNHRADMSYVVTDVDNHLPMVAAGVFGTVILPPVDAADLVARVTASSAVEAMGLGPQVLLDVACSASVAVGTETWARSSGDVEATATAATSVEVIFIPLEGMLSFPFAEDPTGTRELDFSTAVDDPEPVVEAGDNDSVDLWLVFTADAAATLTATFSGPFDVGIEVFTGPVAAGPDDLTLVAEGSPTSVTTGVSDGLTYYVRVHPLEAAETGTGTLTWSVEVRQADVQLRTQVGIGETPGWLVCSVASATAGGLLTFYLNTVVDAIFATNADDAGLAVDISVPLPALVPGAYSLTVVDEESGTDATVDFEVFQVGPEEPDVPAEPSTPATPVVVARWQFEDPAPDGETYVLPINPARMSSPHSERVFSTEHTTSPAGQALTFEGQPKAVDWAVEGAALTEAHIEAMERFHALQRRFFVVDHLGRGWAVTLEALDWQRLRDATNPWAHSYKAKFLVYAGPLDVG
jgi:hypothetical protein